jgi:Holliday junction resolvase RusA-like endonuclease
MWQGNGMKKPTLYGETLPDLSKQVTMQKLQVTAKKAKPIANMLNLWLPYPTSVNAMFAGKTKRYTSADYKAWQAIAGLALNAQSKMLFDCKIAVTYSIKRPLDNRKRDLANLEKGLSDILVKHKIIKDDCLIEKLVMQWRDDGKDGVEVKIERFDNDKQAF